MTLRSSDLQSDSDLDSIRNSCDVLGKHSVSNFFGTSCRKIPNLVSPKLRVARNRIAADVHLKSWSKGPTQCSGGMGQSWQKVGTLSKCSRCRWCRSSRQRSSLGRLGSRSGSDASWCGCSPARGEVPLLSPLQAFKEKKWFFGWYVPK